MTRENDLNWRFIDSGLGTAAFNMALDEALAREAAHSSTATLRVYAWSGPSVSLGCHQRPGSRLDLQRCRAAGVQVVRRITGGREVYHDRELTYSFTGPEGYACLGLGITESYRVIARGLVQALELLGVEPELSGRRPSRHSGAGGLLAPCFASTSRYEITASGKKIVGSAQRRCTRLGSFLQQGSLLLRNSQDRLLELSPAGPVSPEGSPSGPGLAATGLEEVLGRPLEYAEAARAMRQGFEEAFHCRLEPGQPTARELDLARDLEQERYLSLERPERVY